MNSKVGHILSIRFAKQPLHYPIIAQYTRNGLTSYVIPLWKQESQSFTEYREDSYFLEEYRSSISKEAFQMSEQHKACARAFRIQQLLKKSSKRVTRAKGYALALSTFTAQKSYAGQWGNWNESTPMIATVSEKRLVEIQALHVKLGEMFRAEMALAKITI